MPHLQLDSKISRSELAPGLTTLSQLKQANWPRRSRVPFASAVEFASAIPDTALTQVRPALLPAIAVITLSLAGMVPSGLLSLQRRHSKLLRRVFTGCALAVVVSLWIFSGTYTFLSVFALMAVIAQDEYFVMARKNGAYPTRKLGLLGSIGMYAAACSNNPVLRDAIFPMTGVVTAVYLMLRRSAVGIEKDTPPLTINDVTATMMGIYYFGYMPSFWVRLRHLGPLKPSAVLSQMLPPDSVGWKWPLISRIAASSADFFTRGSIIQWWTFFTIVNADVAAYFVGKRIGKTPLVEISPKKTVEGLAGGCLAAMLTSVTGAALMRWPLPLPSGAFYGLMCAVVALIGDLTVSLIKRSSGSKDTGCLLPGHGGLLDRIDSYLLVSAPAYFFVRWLLPQVQPGA